MRGVVAGVAISGLLVACAMQSKPAAMASSTQADAGMPTGRVDHSQIEQLVADIDQKLDGRTLPPFDGAPVPMAELKVCAPAPGDTCKTSCDLSGAICDNAKKICDLASQMPGDAWASGKCDDSTKKCDQAHEACCSCT